MINHGFACSRAVLRTLSLVFLLAATQVSMASSDPPRVAQSATTAAAINTAAAIITAHQGNFGGRRVVFDALVEETLISNGKGDPTAILSSFSYIERRKTGDAERPVLFAFNGGPGSSSVWLHLGLLGPRRVDFADPVNPPTVAPFRLSNNPHAPLDVADVVLIDPVSTGFSRVLPGARVEDLFSVAADARATAEFIRQWLTRHGRWNSPIYVIGESYGTVRAIALAGALAGGVFPPNGTLGAINLSGIAIVGPAFGNAAARLEGNDRAALTDLSAMSATAWHHGKAGSKDLPLEEWIDAARTFAGDDYLKALHAGHLLAPQERARIAARLAALTGVSAAAWSGANLRLGMAAFQSQLLADRGLTVGAYDSRYTLPTRPNGNDPVVDDPAMGQYVPGFVGALNQYLTTELGVRSATRYIPINFSEVNFKWDWGAGPGVVLPRNDATDLAVALRRNPSLRVFVAAGYFDLVTTLGAAEYALAHSAIDRRRVILKGYPSGHMPYLGEDSALALAADLREFLRGGLPSAAPPATANAGR